jgi:two-component system phosphate regulon response regulator PhoB
VARILAIGQESDFRAVLDESAAQTGHRAFVAPTGEGGLKVAREVRPDLVLLDLILPDVPGISVAKELQRDPETRQIPIIMVAAKADEIDRVVGFEIGADDFVVKPFNVRELLLRIEAVLRRSQPQNPQILNVGEMRVDRQAHRVTVNAQEIAMTPLEFKLLVTLIERRGRVQPRRTLLIDVWGVDPNVTTRTVDTHVKRVRDKLGSAGRLIQTVRGVGYRVSEDGGKE